MVRPVEQEREEDIIDVETVNYSLVYEDVVYEGEQASRVQREIDPDQVKTKKKDSEQCFSMMNKVCASSSGASAQNSVPEEVALLLNFSQGTSARQPTIKQPVPCIKKPIPILRSKPGPYIPRTVRRIVPPAIREETVVDDGFMSMNPYGTVSTSTSMFRHDYAMNNRVHIKTMPHYSVRPVFAVQKLNSQPLTGLAKTAASTSTGRRRRGRPPRYELPPNTPAEEESRVREKETQKRARVAKKSRLNNQKEVVDYVYLKLDMLSNSQVNDSIRELLDEIKTALYRMIAERDRKQCHEITLNNYQDYFRSEAGVIKRPGPLPKHMLPELANITDPKERQRLRNCAAQRRYREATNAQETMYNEVVHRYVPLLTRAKSGVTVDLAVSINDIIERLCSATKKKELEALHMAASQSPTLSIDVCTYSD